MPPHATPDPTQSLVLRAYTTLHELRPFWGGSITLSLGLNPPARVLSLASNIAGAVSLSIDNDPAHLREAIRTGTCDFVVNTLDEALRAMKNEVRKSAPLSVGLEADPFLALNELAERGLAPQLFINFLPKDLRIDEAAVHFHSIGAKLLHFDEPDPSPAVEFSNQEKVTQGFSLGSLNQPKERGAGSPGLQPWASPGVIDWQSSQSLLAPLIEQQNWTLHTFSFETQAALRDFDAQALASLPPEDALRRRWLLAAPRVLHRLRPPHRSLWLNEAELHPLGDAFTS